MCFGGGGLRKSQAERDLENYRSEDYGPLPSTGTEEAYRFVEPAYRPYGGMSQRSLLLPVRK